MILSRQIMFIADVVAAATLAACVSSRDIGKRLQSDPAADSAQAARSIYSDRTFISHDPHGTQIEYHGPDGRAHLWYPGNFRGVPSIWKIEYDGPGKGHEICWQYPASSRNGLTGLSAGGKFQCTPDWLYFPSIVQVLQGDPFNLNSGRVPFPMPKGKFTAEQLAQQANIPADRVRTIYKEY